MSVNERDEFTVGSGWRVPLCGGRGHPAADLALAETINVSWILFSLQLHREVAEIWHASLALVRLAHGH